MNGNNEFLPNFSKPVMQKLFLRRKKKTNLANASHYHFPQGFPVSCQNTFKMQRFIVTFFDGKWSFLIKAKLALAMICLSIERLFHNFSFDKSVKINPWNKYHIHEVCVPYITLIRWELWPFYSRSNYLPPPLHESFFQYKPVDIFGLVWINRTSTTLKGAYSV